MIVNEKYLANNEAAKLLGVSKRQINYLIKDKRLEKKMHEGKRKISGESISKYQIDRNQKIPNGYISMEKGMESTGFKEIVFVCAAYRKELKVENYRSGKIIEFDTFSRWFSFLVSHGRILLSKQKEKQKIEGNILVENIKGLHHRPCCDLYCLSLKYHNVDTHFLLSKDDQKAHGEVLSELVGLDACHKDNLKYEIMGEFCDECLLEMQDLFKNFEKYIRQPIIENTYDLKAIEQDIKLSLLG